MFIDLHPENVHHVDLAYGVNLANLGHFVKLLLVDLEWFEIVIKVLANRINHELDRALFVELVKV